MKLFIGYRAWKSQNYLLNRMNFDDLLRAYITYPAIQVYFALILVCLGYAAFTFSSVWLFLLAVGAGAFLCVIFISAGIIVGTDIRAQEQAPAREPEPDEAPTILDEYANTSSAGSVIAFHKHRADFEAGDTGVLCSFGAGYSIGSVVLRRR